MSAPQPSPDKVDAWIELMRAQQRLLGKIEKALKDAGLPQLTWYDVLWELRKSHPEGVRPKALEKRLLLPQYGLSRLLDRLQKAGLIERHQTPEDRRGQIIHITDAGRRMRKAMWPVYAAALDQEFASRMTISEAQQLRALLSRVGSSA